MFKPLNKSKSEVSVEVPDGARAKPSNISLLSALASRTTREGTGDGSSPATFAVASSTASRKHST